MDEFALRHHAPKGVGTFVELGAGDVAQTVHAKGLAGIRGGDGRINQCPMEVLSSHLAQFG